MRKPLFWIASARKTSGNSRKTQNGQLVLRSGRRKKAVKPYAKALKGQGNAGVVEVVIDADGDACRAVYPLGRSGPEEIQARPCNAPSRSWT